MKDKCSKIHLELMPKRLRKKDKAKHTSTTMVASEDECLEPITKVDTSLSLMVRPKDRHLDPLIKEDAIENFFTLNIQVKNEIIGTVINTNI